jgi:hypothetical protein
VVCSCGSGHRREHPGLVTGRNRSWWESVQSLPHSSQKRFRPSSLPFSATFRPTIRPFHRQSTPSRAFLFRRPHAQLLRWLTLQPRPRPPLTSISSTLHLHVHFHFKLSPAQHSRSIALLMRSKRYRFILNFSVRLPFFYNLLPHLFKTHCPSCPS